MPVTLREDEICHLRGVLAGFYSKLAKMQKWHFQKVNVLLGFQGVDFPIKLIFYGDDFDGKLIGTYRIISAVKSPEEAIPLG